MESYCLTFAEVTKNYGNVSEWLIRDIKNDRLSTEKDCRGETILHHCIYEEKYDTIVYLLERGHVDPNEKNSYGDTALSLMILFWKRNDFFEKIVRLMMKYGANPYIKNNNGISSYDLANDEVKEMFSEIF